MCEQALQTLLERYLLYKQIENVSKLDDCLRVVSAQQLYEILTTIREPQPFNFTVIHLAAGLGHVDIIKRLLQPLDSRQMFEILKVKDINNCALLHQAAKAGCDEIVKFALSSRSRDEVFELLSIRTTEGMTALHVAAYDGHTSLVKCVLQALSCDKIYELLQIKRMNGVTALFDAIQRRHNDTIQCILNAVIPELKYNLLSHELGAFNENILHFSTRNGHTNTLACVFDLLTQEDRFKLIMKQNCKGHTLINHAMDTGQTETIYYLLTTARKDNYLHLLLEKQDHYGFTYLHYAIGCGHIKAIKLALDDPPTMLEIQQLLEIKNNNGKTPEEFASITGRKDIAELLRGYSSGGETSQGHVVDQEESQELTEAAVVERNRQLKVENQNTTDETQLKQQLQRESMVKVEVREEMDKQIEESTSCSPGKHQQIAGEDLEVKLERESQTKKKIKECREPDDEGCKESKKPKLLDQSEQRQDQANQRQLATLSGTDLGRRIVTAETINQNMKEDLAGVSNRVQDLEGSVRYRKVPIGGHEPKLKLLDQLAQRQDQSDEQLVTLGERQVALSGRVDGHDRRITNAELANQSTREELTDVSCRVENLEDNALPIGGHEQPGDEGFLAVQEGADVEEDNQ